MSHSPIGFTRTCVSVASALLISMCMIRAAVGSGVSNPASCDPELDPLEGLICPGVACPYDTVCAWYWNKVGRFWDCDCI